MSKYIDDVKYFNNKVLGRVKRHENLFLNGNCYKYTIFY